MLILKDGTIYDDEAVDGKHRPLVKRLAATPEEMQGFAVMPELCKTVKRQHEMLTEFCILSMELLRMFPHETPELQAKANEAAAIVERMKAAVAQGA